MGTVVSHADVVQAMLARDRHSTDKSKASLKSCCKRWCLSHGLTLDDAAELSLGEPFNEKMRLYQAALQKDSPNEPNAGKNVRSAAKSMRAAYQALLASQGLPVNFNEAFRMAMDAKQMKPADLNRALFDRYYGKENPSWYGAQLWAFYDGTARPGTSWRGDSRQMLSRCEEILGLEVGALLARAYPTVSPILVGAPTSIPYRVARSEQWHAKYALAKLPPRLHKIWCQVVDWRQRDSHLVDGKILVVEGMSIWRGSSAVKHHHAVLRFFGWLCLPQADRPLNEVPKEQRWMTGQGMKVADLRMGQLLDVNLLWKFIEFQQFRQHNNELTRSHLDLLMLANSFVSMPYSFLVAHPELAKEFGFRNPKGHAAWVEEMEELHQALLAIIRPLRRRMASGQRSADEPLRHVMAHEAPYSLFLELVQRMRTGEPLRALKPTWSLWARNLAIFCMELEIPLRVKNLCDLREGTHLTRSAATSLWSIFVPKARLKNGGYSGAVEDINQTYSVETSQAMDLYYYEARPNLAGHDETNHFLLGLPTGRRANSKIAKRTDFRLSEDSIYEIVGKYLEMYFGNTQGVHIFRHLITTDILKEDPRNVDVAAAVLNDSPNTIRKNYKHLVRSDGLRLAEGWRKRQHGRGSSES